MPKNSHKQLRNGVLLTYVISNQLHVAPTLQHTRHATNF